MNLISIAGRVERYAPSGNFGVDRDKERELNELIAVATGKPLTVKVGDSALGNERLVPNQLPNFVASLDAAISLVPDQHRSGVLHHVLADIQRTGFPHTTFVQRFILGIVSEALRALASEQTA